MIHEVIPVLVEELREFLEARINASPEQVVLGNIMNQDGSVAINGEDRLVVSLINVERDGSHQGKGGQTFDGAPPPVHVNVYLLFSAYFRNPNYVEALKFLSGVVGFFQSKTIFDHHNTPELSANTSQVRVEIVNVDWRELSNLWAAIGAKYVPSVLYRIRSLEMNEDRIVDEVPAVNVTDDLLSL